MKKLLFILLLAATVAHAETYKWIDSEGTVHFSESLGEIPATYRKNAGEHSGVPTQVEGIKERMMKDEGTVTLIRALQDDPEMQALMSDPAMVSALQSGDVATLMSNPDFMKILNNPRVREIEKRVNSQGTGTK